MTVSAEPQALESLADLIRRVFVGNRTAHAEQMPDGRYRTVYRAIQNERILSMLKQKRSLLTYQMAYRRLRWICFDVDIRKDVLSLDNFPEVEGRAQAELVAVVQRIACVIADVGVPYLLEASGNRGVHIWLVWREWVPRAEGFALQQLVLDRSGVGADLEFCAVDRFPPSPTSNARLGKGVKLPLSLHTKSCRYAALVPDIPSLRRLLTDLPRNLDPELAGEHLAVLEKFPIPGWEKIRQSFGLEEQAVAPAEPDYLRLQALVADDADLSLDGVLDSLCGCSILRDIVTRYREGEKLSERERTVIVGLLTRLRTSSQISLGRDLLYEFFSRQPGFRPSLTSEKLRNLNLYPPTCSYLKSRFGTQGCPCEADQGFAVVKSPVEFIEGTDPISDYMFAISPSDIDVMVRAQMRYSVRNDEVSLFFIRRRLAALDPSESVDQCRHYLTVQRPLAEYYVFDRPERGDKTRRLVTLSAEDKILSTWFTRILDGLFGAEVSSQSFGYRFEPSFAKANIYKPWLGQWRRYTKELASIIEDDAYADYWVVALDIRSFYDAILIERLRVKLGRGPSRGCEEVLGALDSDSRRKYENIAATLISWCREIGDGERGVPQGPAFARYLSELYLMQFDQDVEAAIADADAHYFRYVDDIFLIVRGENEGQGWNTRLRQMLGELALEVNEDKAFLGTIGQYRAAFREYQDESKYFIDTVSWNTRVASSATESEAISELTDLTLLPDGEGVQTDNAAFFLTHLRDLAPIQATAAEIAPHIWELQYGRGSLFRHMYAFALPQWRASHFAADRIDLSPLTGLKLEVFLNTLLESIVAEGLSDEDVEPLRQTLEHFVRTVESAVGRVLLLHVMLADTRLLNAEFARSLSPDAIIHAVRYGTEAQLPDDLADRLLDEVANFEIAEVIRVLNILLFRNRLSEERYTRASSLFFAAALESLRNTPGGESLPCLMAAGDEGLQLLRKYHQLCCFCSVIGREKDFAELQGVWRALVIATNACGYWRPLRPFWITKAEEVALDQRSATTLLTAVVGGDGLLPGFADRWGVFQSYHGQLVLFLFAHDGLAEGGERDDATLLQTARDAGMLYLEWVLAHRETTSLYPTKPLCLRNIVDNDTMVLRQGQQLLVRQPASRVLNSRPHQLEVISETIELPTNLYRDTVFRYQPAGFVDLSAALADETDLLGMLSRAARVHLNLCRFRAERVPGDCTGVPNVFVDGYRMAAEDGAPLVPDSVFAHKLLLCDTGGTIRSYENTVESSWEILLSRVEGSGHALLSYDHVIQANAEELRSQILPIDADDATSQVQFVEMLVRNIPAPSELTPHVLDRRRFLTMIQFARWLIDQGARYGERIPSVIGLGLRNYLSVTKPGGFARQLVLEPVATPSDATLGALWAALHASIEGVEHDPDLEWGEDSPVQLLQAAFSAVSAAVNVMRSGDAVDVESLMRAMGEAEAGELDDLDGLDLLKEAAVTTGDDNEVELNGLALLPAIGRCSDGRNVYICRFGGFAAKADRLRHSHASELKRTKAYAYSTDAGMLVVIPDDVIRAIFEGIRRRSEALATRSLPQSDQSVVEGLADRLTALNHLRGHPRFNDAVGVLTANHHTSGSLRTRADFERFLIRWLSLFGDDEAEALLQVIAAHECITADDVDGFIQGVTNAQDARHFIFTTKRTDDMGGVQRLFTLSHAGQDIFRALALDTAVQRICEAGRDALPDTLTILTENILSGTQLRRALLGHYLADRPAGGAFAEDARLHALLIDPADFRAVLNGFDRIEVLAAAYTQRGWERVRNAICERLDIPADAVTIRGRVLGDVECFFESSPAIPADTKRAFEHIAGDMDRLRLVFDLPAEAVPAYEMSVHEIADANLLVRPNSVPKKVCGIFTMAPRNQNLCPLFRRIPEHDG